MTHVTRRRDLGGTLPVLHCVFGQRIGEDDNVVNVHAYTGQVASKIRHDPLELASEGICIAGSQQVAGIVIHY